MAYFFVIRSNHAKKNLKAIADIDPNLGVVKSSHFDEKWKDRLGWRCEIEYLIKSPNLKRGFELMKQLREKMGMCLIEKPVRVRSPGGFSTVLDVRPICFRQMEQDEKKIGRKMTRDYSGSSIVEIREGRSRQLIDDNNDFLEVINGDLDLLNFAREIVTTF